MTNTDEPFKASTWPSTTQTNIQKCNRPNLNQSEETPGKGETFDSDKITLSDSWREEVVPRGLPSKKLPSLGSENL